MKRLFDITSSFAGVIILFPILVLVAILIKVTSRGPIIFKQKRVGIGGSTFTIYKFRTMRVDNADDQDQVNASILTSAIDPRITKFGRFLRATSLDELPQLFNVIKGEMGIVGPRPILPEQAKVVPQEYMSRFRVRPGLTGLAQVNGRRSLGWLEQLSYDGKYVENMSVLYDIKIIFLTFYVVIFSKGIYGQSVENWRDYKKRIEEENLK